MLKTDRNIRSSYKRYKGNSENPVDIKRYITIANNFNKYLTDQILEGFEVVLPARLGVLSIQGTKQIVRFDSEGKPILPPDWVRTKILWNKCEECKERKQLVYQTNDHTNGIRYKYFWSKKRVLVENKILYSLRMTRDNKRAVNSNINNGKEYFVQKRKVNGSNT
jgi:hypothetical protein